MPRPFTSRARRVLLGAGIAGFLSGAALGQNLSGAYLAAMQADFRNDYAPAAEYYSRALELDPGNPAILQNAAVAQVALGNVAEAVPLAEELADVQAGNSVAALVRLADALREGEWGPAAAILEGAELELNPLLSGLVAGWIAVGREDFAAAGARFDAMNGNEALAAYGQYHKALALALAGDFIAAAEILGGGESGEPLHLDRDAVIAHAQILAQIDRTDEAIAILDETLALGIPDPALESLRARLEAGEDVHFSRIRSAADGAAEAFLTLANALNTPDSDRVALIHARLAAHIREDLTDAELLAAEVLERHGQYDLATEALATVPTDSPFFVSAEIRRAETQSAAGDDAAAAATLKALAESHPDQIEVHSALGDVLRNLERYDAAIEAYSDALALADTPQRIHWPLFYSRAVAYERAGQFDRAEADFRKALELEPDQPAVLNYLGYSLVEQRRDLDEALDMIERAVAGRPDDGYITDSLGWVLYRLGRFEEAVPHMLRAVELTPDDPVINDHLGDVLWMAGRKREARFQWRRALSFGPADDLDMDRVRRKLELGLDEVLAGEREQAEATDG